jgi:hypothetical protein
VGVTHELLKVIHILMRRVCKMAAQMQGLIIGVSLSEKIGRNLRRDIYVHAEIGMNLRRLNI